MIRPLQLRSGQEDEPPISSLRQATAMEWRHPRWVSSEFAAGTQATHERARANSSPTRTRVARPDAEGDIHRGIVSHHHCKQDCYWRYTNDCVRRLSVE